jgi:hypothetical protein
VVWDFEFHWVGCLPGVQSFRRTVDFNDLSPWLEGLSDVGFLAFSFLAESFVVGFASLVVPCDVVLVAFVDTFGVGSEMSSLAIDTL